MLGDVEFELGPVEQRVLGALMEKDLATPEYYPLSLNALVNACNQKTNRDPVVAYEEPTVRGALESLRDEGLAVFVSEAGSRVLKFRHRLNERFNFSRGELAVMAVLLLRGPQTPGELRSRTMNLHGFADLDAVQHALDKLAGREGEPLAQQLPRAAGMKESRWCHLLAPAPAVSEPAAVSPASTAAQATPGLRDRVEVLEAAVDAIREQVAAMRRDLDELRNALL
jgi:uncharacterized protein YceH (UPF0502 family)